MRWRFWGVALALAAGLALMGCKSSADKPGGEAATEATKPAAPAAKEVPAAPADEGAAVPAKTVAAGKPADPSQLKVKPSAGLKSRAMLKAKPGDKAEKGILKRQVETAGKGTPEPSVPVAPPTPVDLPDIKATATEYPPFVGNRVAIIHTENVIGELEPCG